MEICKKGLVKSTLTDAVRPRINPFHTDISMHVLFTFPKLLQVEFVWQSRVSLIGVHFLCISDLNM